MKNSIKEILRESVIREERIKFDLPIPSSIQIIKDIFKKNGFKLYIVGGAVRDFLLQKKIKDYDLATDAIPDKVEEMMKSGGFRTIGTGQKFGIINVFVNDVGYEIATFRSDGVYNNGRHPESVTFGDIINDALRRDLTCNALYFDIETNEIIDYVGGIHDIKNTIVRTVGNAEDRFAEDKLRILRAIRFASRFGCELDTEIDKVLTKDSDLSLISKERIRDEFIKGITSAINQTYFLTLLDKYGLFKYIFDDLIVDMSGIINNKDYIIVIANILKLNDINKLKVKLNQLKYNHYEIKQICFLIDLLTLSTSNAVKFKRSQSLTNLTDSQIKTFAELNKVDSKLVNTFLKFELSVKGKVVMETYGIESGPKLGELIDALELENFNNIL